MDHISLILEQWARECPDLDTGPMETLTRLLRLSVRLQEGMEEVFVRHGLNMASFDVLATLRRSGPPYGLSPGELVQWTLVTSGTMTNRIDRLQKAGLVERVPDPEDGRACRVTLTEKGLALIDTVLQEHVARQTELVSPLTSEEKQQMDRLMKKWLPAVEK